MGSGGGMSTLATVKPAATAVHSLRNPVQPAATQSTSGRGCGFKYGTFGKKILAFCRVPRTTQAVEAEFGEGARHSFYNLVKQRQLVNLRPGKGKLPGVYVDARHAHEFPEPAEAPRRKARARALGRETITWFPPVLGSMPRPFKSVLLRVQTPGGSAVESGLWTGADWLSATGQPVTARVIEWAYQPRGSGI